MGNCLIISSFVFLFFPSAACVCAYSYKEYCEPPGIERTRGKTIRAGYSGKQRQSTKKSTKERGDKLEKFPFYFFLFVPFLFINIIILENLVFEQFFWSTLSPHICCQIRPKAVSRPGNTCRL